MDALCPHLGANLAAAGRVRGEVLVCPFHGWRFEADGRCSGTGYAPGALPTGADLTGWQVRERGGRIEVRPSATRPLSRRGVGQVPSAAGTWPEGWYRIAFSRELAAGQSIERYYFGQPIPIRRTDVGAVVVRDRPVVERGGLILLWHGPDQPTFSPPDYSRHAGRAWTVRSEVVSASIWDVAENPFDSAHLTTVHHLRPAAPPQVSPDDARLHLRFTADPIIPGLGRFLRTDVHVCAFGAGLTDTRIQSRRLVQPVEMIGCNTPVDSTRTEYTLIFVSSADRLDQRIQHHLSAGIIWRLTAVERRVWRDKRYLKRPCLLPSERGIAAFRRWARQFRCA